MTRCPRWLLYVMLGFTSLTAHVAQADDALPFTVEAAEGYEQEMALIKKADEGDVAAAFNLGYTYYTQQNYPGAIRWYGRAAELGNDRAAFEIAIIYRDGLLGEPDQKKMIKYLTLATKHGLDLALMELAASHLQGTGVKQDVKTAMYFYEKAAQKGNAEAQFALSKLYWSADRGVEDAFASADGQLDEWDARYSSDDRKAGYWLCQSAQQNYAPAQYALSYAYGFGQGDIPLDQKQRKLWLHKAAANGSEQAQQEIANSSVAWYTAAERWAKKLFETTPEPTCPNDAGVLKG